MEIRRQPLRGVSREGRVEGQNLEEKNHDLKEPSQKNQLQAITEEGGPDFI